VGLRTGLDGYEKISIPGPSSPYAIPAPVGGIRTYLLMAFFQAISPSN